MDISYRIDEDDLEEYEHADILAGVVDGPVIFEAYFVLFGWITIFDLPGLSALRCIRIIRIAWLFDIFTVDKPFGYDPSVHILGLKRFCQQLIRISQKIGKELFTQQTRGSLVITVLFFYITYLFAVEFWNDLRKVHFDQDNDFYCSHLNQCLIIMLRLAFYDNVGLDFLQQTVKEGLSEYTFLMLLYLILASMIVLNGLIGIFARIIAGDHDHHSDEYEHEDMIRYSEKRRSGQEDVKFSNGSVDRASQNSSHNSTVGTHRPATGILGALPTVATQPRSVASHKGSDHRSIDTQELAQLVESLRAEVTGMDDKLTLILDLLEARHTSTTSHHTSNRSAKKPLSSHRVLTKVDE